MSDDTGHRAFDLIKFWKELQVGGRLLALCETRTLVMTNEHSQRYYLWVTNDLSSVMGKKPLPITRNGNGRY